MEALAATSELGLGFFEVLECVGRKVLRDQFEAKIALKGNLFLNTFLLKIALWIGNRRKLNRVFVIHGISLTVLISLVEKQISVIQPFVFGNFFIMEKLKDSKIFCHNFDDTFAMVEEIV